LISNDQFAQMLRAAVDQSISALPGYFRLAGITGSPAGTPAPKLASARGTELPFGTAPEGAPTPPGVSAAARKRLAAGPNLSPVPDAVIDPLTRETLRVSPVVGEGLKALTAAAIRFRNISRTAFHRAENGELSLARERLNEQREAAALLRRTSSRLSEPKSATPAQFVQALATEVGVPIQLTRLQLGQLIETLFARPADASAVDSTGENATSSASKSSEEKAGSVSLVCLTPQTWTQLDCSVVFASTIVCRQQMEAIECLFHPSRSLNHRQQVRLRCVGADSMLRLCLRVSSTCSSSRAHNRPQSTCSSCSLARSIYVVVTL